MIEEQSGEWTVSYGLGVTRGDQYEPLPDEVTELPEGIDSARFGLQLPCEIAYEIGWGLALYATALTEWSTDAAASDNEIDAAEAESMQERANFMFKLAEVIRDGSKRGLLLLGEEEPPPYPVQMPGDAIKDEPANDDE